MHISGDYASKNRSKMVLLKNTEADTTSPVRMKSKKCTGQRLVTQSAHEVRSCNWCDQLFASTNMAAPEPARKCLILEDFAC